MRFLSAIVLTFLVACGNPEETPCQQAVNSRTACLDQAGLDYDEKQVDQAQTACVALMISKPGFGSWVDCQTSAFDQADCSTPDAAQLAIEDAEACGNPLD